MFTQFITVKVVAILISIISVMGVGGYVYYQYNLLNTLKLQQLELNDIIERQQKTIDSLKKDYDNIIKAKDEHAKKKDTLNQHSQDFKKELSKGLSEQELNLITDKLFKCLEINTGAANPDKIKC